MTIGKRRKTLGLSQSDLADILGVTQGAISQWEKGTSMPSTEKLPEIAKILGCEIADLFDDGKLEANEG